MMSEESTTDTRMDPNALYREEVFTDRRVGTIRRLTPVTSDGSTDQGRKVLYSGQTQVLTPAGALPISFDLDVQSLEQAVEKFGDAAHQAVENTFKELEELRRESASSIVVPKGGQGSFGGPGAGGGIQIP